MPRRAKAAPAAGRKAARPRRRSAEALDALRYAARCAFTLEHQAVALEDLARRPAFRGVGFARMAQWAREEDWLAERRATVSAWRRRAEVSVSRALQREGRHQRDMLQSLHDQAVALRCQQVVQPRSWEQVASVQLKTAQLLRQWHREDLALAAQAIQPQAAPGAAPSEAASVSHDSLTADEAYRAAQYVLERRLDESVGPELPALEGDGAAAFDATLDTAPEPVAEEAPPSHVASA